ncbi:hypothetical protein Hanom_Chr02g00102871 [Helianthus anomalus]
MQQHDTNIKKKKKKTVNLTYQGFINLELITIFVPVVCQKSLFQSISLKIAISVLVEYFVVHDIGIKTGDTFRFNFSNTNTALSSAAAVSSYLRSLNQGSNNTTGGDKREVFGGLIFTSPDASFFGQPDVNSSPFLDNFPGVAFGGTFCSRVIGRSVLTPYVKKFQEPKAVGCCVHAYCAVYLVMSYTL